MKDCKFNCCRIFLELAVSLVMLGCSSNTKNPVSDTPTVSPIVSGTLTPVHVLVPTDSSLSGQIAYVSSRGGKINIYVMNADGKNQKNLTENLPASFDPTWSPDGKYIAFTSSLTGATYQIFSMKADGSKQQQLTFDKVGSYRPAWSPDGKHIIFLSDRDGVLSDNQGVPVSEIYIMTTDGSEQRRLTNNHDFERSLSWSPNSDVIAVSINPRTNDGIYFPEEIYLLGLDGIIQKQLTDFTFPNENPTWSPNGELIAFASNRNGESGIYIMKADGSNQICLTKSSNTSSSPLYVNNLSPAWSPNGKYIIFSSNRDGDYDLYVIKIDGSELTRLTNDPGDETSPAWSPVP